MAIAMGDSVLDEVRADVQAKVETAGKKWKDDKWEGFVHDAVEWLLGKNEDPDDVAEAAAGLIVYGATTEEKLQSVAGQPPDDEKFTRKLSAKGVPDAICDLLFGKYVDKSAGRPSSDDFGLVELFNQQALQTLGNDGISFAGHHLERKDIVQNVIEVASASQYVVIGSPPATGKTSLMQLVGVALETAGQKVCYFAVRPGDEGVKWLFDKLVLSAGIDLRNGIWTSAALRDFPRVWILIDDAQNAYDKQFWSFWEALVKDLRSTLGGAADKLRCVIAATYDLSTRDSPVHFQGLAHIPPRGSRLVLTPDEAEELYAARAQDRDWETWTDFKETLMRISSGHIGVLMQGLRMLEDARVTPPRRLLHERDALDWLRGGKFFAFLGRCFPDPGVIPQDQRDHILNSIVHAASLAPSGDAMEVDGVEEVSQLASLRRAGVLAPGGGFTCKAAEWYYYNRIFPERSSSAPPNIEALVMDAVSSMSATRLRGACDNGRFPKEAVFQQLFNEAMSRHLPRRNIIIPELNTKAEVGGETKSGELDFYINSELKWALELLREGDSVGEHLSRFHPKSGKYRSVGAKAYLVVDCRGPKLRGGVQSDEDRCTLYFSTDFTSCVCQMRRRKEQVLHLRD